jgi:hypothetical protein
MDLTAWTAKPPPKTDIAPTAGLGEYSSSQSSDSEKDSTRHRSPVSTTSSQDSEGGDIFYDPDASDWQAAQKPSEEDISDVLPQFQQKFYIDVPPMDKEEKELYEYLPGHFSVRSIISEPGSGRFIVRLESGETQKVREMCDAPLCSYCTVVTTTMIDDWSIFCLLPLCLVIH